MCKCEEDINERLTKRYAEGAPTAREHKVRLQGYGILINKEGCVSRPFMEYEATAYVPIKNGGEKVKKSRGNMFFNFCPFCGEKIATG